jgi:TetR/AcrR family transcriptional regulator
MARIRDPEATRAAIIEAAEEIFLAKGFGNTSMSEIARRAKVTKSLIHHHFQSKEGLWSELKARRFKQWADRQMAMLEAAEPSHELLEEGLRQYFRFLQENPQIVRMLAWVYLEEGAVPAIPVAHELTKLGTEMVRKAQDRGELRADVDARFILFTFIGLCQHYFQDKGHLLADYDWGGSSGDLDNAYLRDMTKIFFEGILPR